MMPIERLNKSIHKAVCECEPSEVQSVLIGHLVGLTLELVRHQGLDDTKTILLKCIPNRNITIHALEPGEAS